MFDEEVYLLDNMTYIETESFVSLRGHSTVVAGLRAFADWKKEMRYFIALSAPSKTGLSIPGGTKRLVARNKSARELSKNLSQRGKTGFVAPQAQPVGPLLSSHRAPSPVQPQ